MSVLDDLRAMRELLEDPEHWTKGGLAFEADGGLVGEGFAPGAVCWCLLGAAEKVTHTELLNLGPADAVAAVLARAIGREHGGVSGFNDAFYTTHADVLALLDRAIEREEQRAETAA